MSYQMTTQAAIREAFWEQHGEVVVCRHCGSGYHGARTHRFARAIHQDDYPPDTRCAFVDFVDSLQKDGVISEALAGRVTL